MRSSNRLVAGLVAGSLLAGSAGGVLAAKTPARARGIVVVAGQISGLSATGFTLTRQVGKAATATPVSTTVTVVAGTKQRARQGTTGQLANGEYAVVVGTRSTAGINARRVLYSAAKFNLHRVSSRVQQRIRAARAHRAVGLVNTAASSATTLAITNKAGKALTFVLTATTKFRVNKVLSTTVPAFTAGERVVVRYKRDKVTRSLVATVIMIRAPRAVAPIQP